MPCENQTNREAQVFPKPFLKIHQFEHLIKTYGKIILESNGFSSSITRLAENIAGKRADLVCMEMPSGNPTPCSPT